MKYYKVSRMEGTVEIIYYYSFTLQAEQLRTSSPRARGEANCGHLDDRTCTSTTAASPSPTKMAAEGFSQGHKPTVIKRMGDVVTYWKVESRLKDCR